MFQFPMLITDFIIFKYLNVILFGTFLEYFKQASIGEVLQMCSLVPLCSSTTMIPQEKLCMIEKRRSRLHIGENLC